ncbi:aldehyde dehydrogenase family protein, partial [Cryobacterium tagatosivorans]
MNAIPTVSHWIDGAAAAGTSTRTAPVFNPATGQVARNVSLASTADVDVAIASALAAFPAWRDTSQAKRQTILFNFRELLNARK